MVVHAARQLFPMPSKNHLPMAMTLFRHLEEVFLSFFPHFIERAKFSCDILQSEFVRFLEKRIIDFGHHGDLFAR